ncbi:MAG: hypothetical protein ACT4RN_16590 [Pseudonocardia sp.]
MSRSQTVAVAAAVAVTAAVAALVTYVLVRPAPAPAAASTTPATTTASGGSAAGATVITAFHLIGEVSCTGASAAVPAAWGTRDAQAVSFEVDGQPLPAAAGYPVSGTGNIPVPCDGNEHQVTLVASGPGPPVQRSAHVNTQNATPPPAGPTVTAFQILADVTCPGGQPIPVAAAWATQNATVVSFSVDGQPLPAAAGYPVSGTGNIPVPCDGRAHKVTITAANAANAQAALSRSVNTTPYAPVPPPATTTATVAPATPTSTTAPATPTPTG